MRRVSQNVYAEIYFWGCNPGFLVTSEGAGSRYAIVSAISTP